PRRDVIRFKLGTDDGKTQVRLMSMPNAQCSMLNAQRGRPARVCVLGCALTFGHWALSIAPVSAQQQPGMPGSMGFSSGIVASNVPPQFKDVTFAQRLGQKLPLAARLRDEGGRNVTLGDYFGKKPVVLAFVYYQCPMLCTQVMNGISSSLK